MPGDIVPLELREATAGDQDFLFRLYCDVRGPEVEAWGWPAIQRDAFLKMQFLAQSRSYATAYPDATHHIVYSGGAAAGRRLVARTGEGLHLIDIALLAAHRNHGLGAQLIQPLIDECRTRQCALHLQVLRGNPALRLYQRLGFRETGSDAMYIQMQWTPAAAHPA